MSAKKLSMTEQTQNTTGKKESMARAQKSSIDENIDETIRAIFLSDGGDKNKCPERVTLDMLAQAMGAELTPQLNDVGIQVERGNIDGLWFAYYTVMNLEYLNRTTDYQWPITENSDSLGVWTGQMSSEDGNGVFQDIGGIGGGLDSIDNDNNNSKKSSE